MKSAVLFAFLICFALVCVADAQVELTLVTSPDAPGKLSVSTLQHCVLQLGREWNLPLDKLPRILVFHLSKRAAKPFMESDVAVRRNTGAETRDYYEVWIVGLPEHKYLLALENVLEYHFRIAPLELERAKVLARVARMDESTISISDLQGK